MRGGEGEKKTEEAEEEGGGERVSKRELQK